MEELINWQ